MPKKTWGRKNSITILYIMLIRYGTIGRQILYYIALFFFAFLSSSILYTRNAYAYILLLLYYFILLRFILLLLFYLLLYYTLFLYTRSTKRNRTKTIYLLLYLLSTHICTLKHAQLVLILHMSVFSPCLSLRPKIQNLSNSFCLLLS